MVLGYEALRTGVMNFFHLLCKYFFLWRRMGSGIVMVRLRVACPRFHRWFGFPLLISYIFLLYFYGLKQHSGI